MTPRYIVTRRDNSETFITDAIKAAGVKMYKKMPCDLLCRVDSDPPGMLRAIEIKTAKGKRAPKLLLDKRQTEQAAFCKDTGTPYVTTIAGALSALGIEFHGDAK